MNRMRPSVETTIESDAIAGERTLAGDRDAFRILVERHSRNVFRLAYRMTGNQPKKSSRRLFCALIKN